MEKIRLNTSLFPVADVAMYGTMLDSGEIEYYLNQCEEEQIEINQDKYEKELVFIASEFIKDNVLEQLKCHGVVSIDNFSLYKPQYYNYQNDMLCFDVTLKDDFDSLMKHYMYYFGNVDKREGQFSKYIKEHWQSCSGFISFMPESLEEVLNPKKHFNMRVHQVAAYLTLCLIGHPDIDFDEIGKSQDKFYEYLITHSSEFVEYKNAAV